MSLLRRIGAGLAVVLIAVLATAVPASAHDQLASSTPAEGEALETAPDEVVMTFTGDLIVLDASMTGAVVMVVDASGRDWVSGEIVVDGRTVTAQLEAGMPVAGYQVRWQVVSEDGHPISGAIPFTIGDAAPMVTAGNSDSATNSDVAATDQIADESSSVVRMLLVGAGGAAIAAAGFALYRFLRRRKATAAPPEPGDDAAEHI
ncbi:copper resistance CopC family protein [Microbacterium sp. LWH12-1.2]|uniref:copper resistance CopC family protein n=1 Tax=Microbacterium sp. LWH12-1.2 TaxID=3135259 RepID=UPI003444DB9F